MPLPTTNNEAIADSHCRALPTKMLSSAIDSLEPKGGANPGPQLLLLPSLALPSGLTELQHGNQLHRGFRRYIDLPRLLDASTAVGTFPHDSPHHRPHLL